MKSFSYEDPFGPMKQGSFFWSRVQIIVGVIVSEIQTAAGVLGLQEEIQSEWRGLISNTNRMKAWSEEKYRVC